MQLYTYSLSGGRRQAPGAVAKEVSQGPHELFDAPRFPGSNVVLREPLVHDDETTTELFVEQQKSVAQEEAARNLRRTL